VKYECKCIRVDWQLATHNWQLIHDKHQDVEEPKKLIEEFDPGSA
jgi:hypothetical protein